MKTPTAPASLPPAAESSARQWKYEVFLSFRREDTVRGFTSYLYNELQRREIKTFMDNDETTGGEGISQVILEAIEESRFAIVVLSENYATSSRCLDELTQIIQYMEIQGTVVLPVYYHVDPSVVHRQMGAHGEAFANHEMRFKDQTERLWKWRDALTKVSNIFGWTEDNNKSERQLVKEIVEFVCSKPIESDTRQATDEISPQWKYDVFINFRGEDTRNGFLSHLQDELENKDLTIVRDNGPDAIGQIIKMYLQRAIEESRFAIVVLSPNFASSQWCLEELAFIFECMGGQNRILPIFYQVDPSAVRHQIGSFGEGLARFETRVEKEKVMLWRHALSMVANLSGFVTSGYKNDGELISNVVEECRIRRIQEVTGDLEKTGDVGSISSPLPEPAPVKNDVLSGFGMEDTRTGNVALSDHALQNTGVSRTFRDEDQLGKRAALPSMSPENGEFFNSKGEDTREGFIANLGHVTQNTAGDHPEEEIVIPSTSLPSRPDEGLPRVKYDVFLSFSGEDTREGFIAYLYRELQHTRVIKTFKDDVQLEKGTVIASNLLRAIEESRYAIIVFSEKYADSPWCLAELAKIFQCMEGKDTILPIFYKLDPAVVRHQKKETSFGDAFVKHEARYEIEKTNQWRAALNGVAGILGWHTKEFGTEIELILDIVKHLLKKVLQEPIGNFKTFEATRQAMDEVMKVLKDDQFTVIGVHGVAGVGKTTMVKHVGAQATKDGLFDSVIMVVISKSPDWQEIQGTLADSWKEGIMRGDRMLIILDDVWKRFKLSSIGIPGHHDLQRCNSKVILTTRHGNVCHSMGCHAQIPLYVLSDEDSWKLLKETSGKSFDESTYSYDEERKEAEECRGLPRAIKAAARSLGDRDWKDWNEAVATKFGGVDNWNEAAQAFYLEAGKGAFNSLGDAYHSLESDDAKLCFLLCCLFPEEFDIPIEELLRYGIGLGLFQYDSMHEARDRAHTVVKYLKASRLLLNGTNERCVRMTDDIRNFAMSIAPSEVGGGLLVKAGCDLEEWPGPEAGWWLVWTWTQSWLWDCPIDTHEGYSIISLMRNKLQKLPESLVCSKLQILLLQSNSIFDIPETFLQDPNELRVLDLSLTSISSLPQSFSFLTSLQALNLDNCDNLSEISVLGNLKKLEILSMRELPLKILPKQIGDLTGLRKLDVTGRHLETIPSKVLSKLYRLEELHMKFQFGKWGSRIEDASEETNANFDELTDLLDLSILEVYISDATCLPQSVGHFKPNWVEFDICISSDVPQHDGFSRILTLDTTISSLPDGFSRILTLDTTISSLPDWFISVVTAKVEKLEYTNCHDLNDLAGEYDHGRLFLLKYLSVKGHHENLKEIINTMRRVSNTPVFENLEELRLHCLHAVNELCVGELPLMSLCKLKLLKVETCHSLVNALLPSTLFLRLQNLEKVICVNLDRMKYVFGSSEGVVDPEKIFMRKLREVRLCALEELVSICNGPTPHAMFQNLKVLAICECKELKSLFRIDVADCLFQLEDLCVERCPSLDRVIEASNSLNGEITLPALKKLALIDLPVLTRFCTENVTIETHCPSLEYLYVKNCIKFSYYDCHFSKKQILFNNDEDHKNFLKQRWEEMHNA